LNINQANQGSDNKMDITYFALEKWYTKYEFSSKYNLSASGIRPLTLNELGIDDGYREMPLGYTPAAGNRDLITILAEKYSAGQEEIMVTNGAIEALFLAQMALIRKGDKVITIMPVYPALYQVAADLGAEIIEWKLEFSEGFQPDTTRLEKLLETYRPRMLVINFPHNPTGVCLAPEQLQEICRLARKFNCFLLSDEIYNEMSYSEPQQSAFSLYPEGAISISSLSKAFGLPGLRTGWLAANREIIEKCLNLRHYTSLCNNYLGEAFAVKALKNSGKITGNSLKHAFSNYLVLKEKLSPWQNEFDLDFVEPQAGVIIFIKLNRLKDTEDFCVEFEKETGILLLPGNKYGPEYSGFFRLGFGGKQDELIFCLARLENFLYEYF
jgi:aspartate/methionine/tyrosine aminotransferase